ncbi:MAG TPA: DUF4131 domain-containing protein [Caldimonas sp.]
MAREIDQVAGPHKGHVGAGRNGERRQRDVEVGEAVVDGGHGFFLKGAGPSANPTLRRWEEPTLAGVSPGSRSPGSPAWHSICRRGRCGRPRCYAALGLGGALALCAAWRWRRAFVLALAGAALCGAAASGWCASLHMADALDPAVEGQDLVVTGIVASLPQQSASGLRFRLEVESASQRGQELRVPPQLALGWYKGFHEDASLSASCAPASAGASRCACASRTATSTRTATTTS